MRAIGIRALGLYCAKDTFVSLALTAGVNVHCIEGQVGVSYLVLRKHYGRYMTSEGPDQLAKMKPSARDFGVQDEEGALAAAPA